MNTADLDPRRRDAARNLGEQAAEWLLILEDADQAQRDAFTDWLSQSPLHVEAFLRAATMDSLLNKIDEQKTLPIDPLSVGSSSTEHNLATQPAKPRAWGRLAIAATILVTLATALFVARTAIFPNANSTSYTTAIGEQRVFELDDGSVLHMNTGSKVNVSFSANERRIDLIEGEAMFRVHPDPTRPFRVHSDAAVIQAIGTQFNVNRTRDASVVSVIEGVVQVSQQQHQPVKVVAGEEVKVGRQTDAVEPTRADIDRVGAWRQRRLIFVNESLANIAEEFNRYNRSPKIRIEGEAVGVRKYAAAFDADDPESLMTVLEKDRSLRILQKDGEIVVAEARSQ